MLFGKLLPREGNFFDLFNQHAEYTVQTAQAFARLVEHYAEEPLRLQYTRAVDDAEHAADGVTRQVAQALHTSFITPLDREQIHSLINTMDDVADLLQDCAQSMERYDVRHITQATRHLTDLCVCACEKLRDALALLSRMGKEDSASKISTACGDIDRIEEEADRVMRDAVSALFRQEEDVREIIKLKAIYELLEAITDRCEDAAKLIEGIVLEHS